ncbi:hypothetical protein [Mesorhizobium sp. LSJC255A00]|uniref:hypothetical protein n=1 Tax=Mesorhizobium sp. LSJC255A00 TaxID=1287313 RepID=UPI0018DC1849|nr:hypothetical protein [Mesorhizobium sp. LSJC255A00]
MEKTLDDAVWAYLATRHEGRRASKGLDWDALDSPAPEGKDREASKQGEVSVSDR